MDARSRGAGSTIIGRIGLGAALLGAACALSAATARADDPARRRPAPPASTPPGEAVQGHDWTGAYIGLNAGYAAGGRGRGDRPSGDDRFPPARTRTRP